MCAVLVAQAKYGEENDACDNRESVLVDGPEEIEREFEHGATGELAGRRVEGDAEECEDGVKELVEQGEQRNTGSRRGFGRFRRRCRRN